MKVNGHGFGGIFLEKSRHRPRDLFLRRRRWKFVHCFVVLVLDLQGVEEISKHFLVGVEQPGLQKMGCERVAERPAKCRLHPRETLPWRFSFNENRPEIPLIGQALDRGFIDRLLLGVQKSKNLRGQAGRHSLENFVRFHHSADTMTASSGSSIGALAFRDG